MESQDSKLIADGRAWKVDGRAQALVGAGLATPLSILVTSIHIGIDNIYHTIWYNNYIIYDIGRRKIRTVLRMKLPYNVQALFNSCHNIVHVGK